MKSLLVIISVSLLPSLSSLTVSSLYRDDPTRGLPFHFHLPRPEEPQERQPLVDLKLLAGLRHLESLHLNVSYPAAGQLEQEDSSLAALLIKDFPRLTRLSLDNFVGRRGSPLSYSLHRARLQSRLEWVLQQHNRSTVISLS